MRYNQQQHQQQKARKDLAAADRNSSSSSDKRPLLLLTDMHAGHFAASAASSRLQERAMKLAFVLHNLGVRGC
jgi:protease II